ncbi:hypothetical protein [Mycobacterium paraffinicum]|uniref:hypothetical protein n=1 Tax=Mycobacterium paraffinicum TaxID=53378 RepID=UPI00093CE306|nr:hypothetical protein [Mycobacterium paraffinicum]
MGDPPPSFGGIPPIGSPQGDWQHSYPLQPARRPRAWPAVSLASAAVVLGVVAVVVSSLGSTKHSTPEPATVSAAPTYTPAETAAAHKKLCDVYDLAARAVQIETNGASPERAGIATVNGAVLLGQVLNDSPAIPPGDRGAAVALAEAYSNAAAVASFGDSAQWQSTIADVNAKDAGMKRVCGGG